MFWLSLYKIKLLQTRISKSVPIKQLKASVAVQTIGSPLTLKDVLTKTGYLVILSNSFINLWNIGLVSVSVLLSIFLGWVLGLGGVGGDARLTDDLLGKDFGAFLATLASFARFWPCACAWGH